MEIGAIVFWVLIVYFLSFLGLLLYVLNRPNEPARDELFGGPLEPRRKESETAPTPRLTHQVNYNRAVDTKSMVNCEYCGESIRPIAIRCPHCHEDRSEYVDKMFKNV